MGFHVATLVILASIAASCFCVLNPGCECVTFQGKPGRLSGTFTSPGYPTTYRSGISCVLYTFVAPVNSNYIVEIILTDLDLGNASSSGSCNTEDKLRLYLDQSEPGINEQTLPNTQLCGTLDLLRARHFYSSNRVLVLELSSDTQESNLNTRRVFKGTYNFLDASLFKSDGNRLQGTDCTYYILSVAKRNGKIFSPYYPQNYGNNMNCAWIFKGDNGDRVHITFLKIDLATQGLQDTLTCQTNDQQNDLLTVYDGDSEESPVIGRYCGRGVSREIRSTGSIMRLTFKTNSYGSMMGFAALYNFTKITLAPRKPGTIESTCDLNINSSMLRSASISSPNYPENYVSGTSCTYVFQGRPNERVVIKFSDFDLGSSDSSCDLADRLMASVKVNSSYLTTMKVMCGSKLPLSMMSNGPFLQLKFESVYRNPQARGFNFTFNFVDDFGIKSDERVPFLRCANQYKASVNLTGEITSPNYPGLYPHDTSCIYIFIGEGKKVMIKFTHFDVKGIPPECLEENYSDFVSFSNSADADDKKMSRYCVSDRIVPPYILGKPVISDSDFFRMKFVSGLSHLGTGFKAVYTFLDESNGQSELASAQNNPSHGGLIKSDTRVTSIAILMCITFIFL